METAGKRIVVTGGAGFIGSHLVDALLARGGEVVVVDDFSTGKRSNLDHHRANGNLEVVEADIRDFQALRAPFKGAEAVFHLACRNVRLSLVRPTEVHEINATGTLNVLKAAVESGIRRFLYCSSSEVNGTADLVPMPEKYHFAPETIYGASKLAGEYYTQVFHRAGWLPTVIARPHNNYGPREHYQDYSGEVIPRFILWALAGKPPLIYGTGEQTRDFTYVEETASYLIRLLEHEASLGKVFNICRGDEVSILEVARMVIELTGSDLAPRHLPGRPSDVLRLYGDPSRLRRLLGDSPKIGFRQGLARTIDWFRENVDLSEEVLESMAPESWQELIPEDWLEDLVKK